MAEEKNEQTAKIDQAKQEKLKAKTETANKDDEIKAQSPEELRQMLSNKNQDYVFRLQKELEKQGKLSVDDAKAKVDALLPEIVIAQRHGQPANGLYMASPVIKAGAILHPEVKPKTMLDIPFWQRAVDNILLWLALFTAFYGIMGLFNTKIQSAQNGITTIVVICVLLGLFWAKYNEWMMPVSASNKKPKLGWSKLIIYSIAFVVLLMLIMGIVAMPAFNALNPVLPAIVYIIIAAACYGVRYLFRKKYDITGNLFMPSPQARRNK